MNTAPTYHVTPGDVRCDRETVLGVWSGNLGHDERMRAKFDWFYQRSPTGYPMLQLLRVGPQGTTVGVASVGRRRMVLDGREVRAGVLVDLAVVREHRALGPAVLLQQSLVRDAAQAFDLVYGFPNPKAVPVFKRAGYRQMGEMLRLVRVLRHARYLKGRSPAPVALLGSLLLDVFARMRDELRRVRRRAPLAARWSDQADGEIDALWARHPVRGALSAIRDTAFCSWRFDASPLASTRYLLLHGKDGALRAWFACQSEHGVLRVCDFHSDDAGPAVGGGYICELLRQARKQGHCSVSVEFSGASAMQEAWLAAGFAARTRRPVFGLWLGSAAAGNVFPLHLTCADEDE